MDKKPNKIHKNLISINIEQSYHTLLIHIQQQQQQTQTYFITGQQVLS